MPMRTSRPGAALTSRSSEVVCAAATVAATAQHDALIRSRATFLLELDVSPSLARRPQTACAFCYGPQTEHCRLDCSAFARQSRELPRPTATTQVAGLAGPILLRVSSELLHD